ncbi:sterol desaturase/sphingolipid hydroxylase (fatty acid hydroxylase superfamily) [Aquimarina sp. EL_43]|uniref:sterol desaturase family protein n=1 Tax=Aquimarina TaxID=290174 RepID=UPI000472944F|nr:MULTISPECIES: sterol desaturase family protein [Aquimarina]MBG6130706.1 sterol desaturase/sphingolipid hydroxylase (fatty acid hydroxylase superfamily) [Aquimarina sp. EL_35]MBG6151148.1 sterol desaturase/sphingolipid hydroxylase (fatty acid hydroxylase superfamily) [Aquimarina sp. EL_32]MBG6169108.1 sterol desaturase/sphingolipid hydroxylase (fatty acid hydroxylase superfamily) [Aquimarina sp. EL_43]
MKQHKILSVLTVPALLLITGIIASLTISKRWSFEISSYAIFLFTAIYILIFEQIIPLKIDWKTKRNNLFTDIKHFIFSTALFDALGKTVSLSFVLYLQQNFFIASEIWDDVPLVLIFVVANIIGEFLPYFYHRISHIGNLNSILSLLLWKIHSIHHLPTSLNWFKTNWIHPINIFLNTVFKMVPLLLLGFNKDMIFLVGVTHVVIAYISHANIKTKTGFLDYLIVTPRLHHFHHSKLLHEAKNYGNILPYWDLVFGTYYNRKGEVDDVGVIENHMLYPKQKNYLQQLLFPFKRVFKECCQVK